MATKLDHRQLNSQRSVFPDTSYFGKKDAQQIVVIKKMVRDLNFNK